MIRFTDTHFAIATGSSREKDLPQINCNQNINIAPAEEVLT